MYFRLNQLGCFMELLVSIVVSIPACHAGDRGSIPRRGGQNIFCFLSIHLFLQRGSKPMSETSDSSAAFNPSKVHRHTAVNTDTPWTHTQSSGQPFMLRRPGSSWGFGVLLKSTSVVVLRVERAVHSLPPPTIPAWPENQTRNLWITSPTL